jgi:hypothetical protein
MLRLARQRIRAPAEYAGVTALRQKGGPVNHHLPLHDLVPYAQYGVSPKVPPAWDVALYRRRSRSRPVVGATANYRTVSPSFQVFLRTPRLLTMPRPCGTRLRLRPQYQSPLRAIRGADAAALRSRRRPRIPFDNLGLIHISAYHGHSGVYQYNFPRS